MRIAVVGAGISGLTAAYLLNAAHDVTLFEQEPRLGGHAHTHEVTLGGRTWAVDSGFMVFNTRTYPTFIRLLTELGVESRPSDMSFSVRCRRCTLEFSSVGLSGLFAQRSRLWSAGHLRLLADVLRFFRRGRQALAAGTTLSLGALLDQGNYSDGLARHFVIPMGGAIWSASAADMRAFPAASFLRFLDNHGLLAVSGQPTWRTVVGGSRQYVEAIATRLRHRPRASTPVTAIERLEAGVTITMASGAIERFDKVVVATHADQALQMLVDASADERRALGAFRYSTNDTWLHSDSRMLPYTLAARASWNCDLLDCRDDRSPVSVTYDLNRLQGHTPGVPVLCSLNPVAPIEGDAMARIGYTHPILDGPAVAAQVLVAQLNGARHTYYCGAHLRYGFHEDGAASAVDVVRRLGVQW